MAITQPFTGLWAFASCSERTSGPSFHSWSGRVIQPQWRMHIYKRSDPRGPQLI